MLGEVDRRAENARSRGQDQCGIADCGEADEPRAERLVDDELASHFDREAGLARAARAGDRHEPRPFRAEQRDRPPELRRAPQQGDDGCRNVRVVQRLQRRERPAPELKQPHRCIDVLEPVLAEITHRRTVLAGGERGCRDEDLAAVAGRHDPRAQVDVQADVAVVRQRRLAAVNAHADPYVPTVERRLCLPCGGERTRRRRERDEECVPLRVHLHAAVRGERLSKHVPVLRQNLRVPVGAQLVQQPRRPLDVGEQEGDGAGWQIRPHGESEPREPPCVYG